MRTLLGLFGGAISAPHFRRNGARCSSASREDSEKRPQNEGHDGGQRPPSSAARLASPRLLPRACKVHFRARLGTATLPAPLRRLQLFLPKPQGAGRRRDRRCTEQRGASAERRARRLRGPHPARSPAPWPCRCFLHQREREALGGARRRFPITRPAGGRAGTRTPGWNARRCSRRLLGREEGTRPASHPSRGSECAPAPHRRSGTWERRVPRPGDRSPLPPAAQTTGFVPPRCSGDAPAPRVARSLRSVSVSAPSSPCRRPRSRGG